MEIILNENNTTIELDDEEYRYNLILEKFSKGKIIREFQKEDTCHVNYLSYLGRCWSHHFGAIIDPTFFWQMILCELAIIIKNNSEVYRHHFSNSQESQEILILIDDPIQINVKELCNCLRNLINEDINIFLPQFSTQTEQSNLAHCAAFCDAVSPFYHYGMYLCDIPKFKIRGSREDWHLFHTNLEKLKLIFPTKTEWLNEIIKLDFTSTDVDFWKNCFKMKRCGSGSQFTIDGWITKFFVEKPSFALECNFSTHVSEVNYKNLANKKEYVMFSGLFSSKIVDDYLEPQFSMIINEKVTEQQSQPATPKQDPMIL